eukprot:m.104501 g.104501  ORF g.104501 m.104501 type:complete len:120 (+) comp15249_c0_seq1:248-607(+)
MPLPGSESEDVFTGFGYVSNTLEVQPLNLDSIVVSRDGTISSNHLPTTVVAAPHFGFGSAQQPSSSTPSRYRHGRFLSKWITCQSCNQAAWAGMFVACFLAAAGFVLVNVTFARELTSR